MLSAVVSDKVDQLQTNVNIIMERRDALSNEMDFRFSRVADHLAIVEQSLGSAFIKGLTARVPR